MASWPETEELKQVLDVTSDDWNDTLDRIRLAAISQVKGDVGAWDELSDVPDESLAQAALRMAELMSERPSGITLGSSLRRDPTYTTLLAGHRRTFGIG
jgi:hypothetical protein